jgi:hypothetical protein
MEVLCKDYSFRPYQLTNMAAELPMVAMFVNGSGRMSNRYRGPPIDAS